MEFINSSEATFYEGQFERIYEVTYEPSYQQKFKSNKNEDIKNISSIIFSQYYPTKHSCGQAVGNAGNIQTHRRTPTSAMSACITKGARRDGEPSRLRRWKKFMN